MTEFSANLGFLWTDRPLPDAIRAAGAHGFHAVECHFPYDIPAPEVAAALDETGLAMLGLNTRPGDLAAGERGLAAVPGRTDEARALIAEALDYAGAVGAAAVHVMAGNASGEGARRAFVDNLRFAAARAEPLGVTVLIEPLNRHDAPGYFLRTTDQARDLVGEVGTDSLRIMFDCYHVGRTEGDLITRFRELRPLIGHVQFAGVPDRGPPNRGEIDYRAVFAAIADTGWSTPLGAEYLTGGDTAATLGWMSDLV